MATSSAEYGVRLTDELIAELSTWSYLGIRNEYYSVIVHTIENFLLGHIDRPAGRKTMGDAMRDAYADTANEAWKDGGAELPLDRQAKEWLDGRVMAESGYIYSLFSTLEMMKGELSSAEILAEATKRADGYCQSLDAIYANIKVMAAGNKMLTFAGDDGDESCKDCKKYKGKRHRAKWWFAHNAVPPCRDFECGGYKCQHFLQDDEGHPFTL